MPQNKADHTVYEQPLGDGLKYLKALVTRYPGTIAFEAGAGHILHDLLARLPNVPQLEAEKAALCNRIVETVYPLAACLFAEGVCMTLTATSEPLAPPRVMDGLATYTAFDAEHNVMRHYFMSPPHAASYLETLSIPSGLGVLCEPLNYDNHRLHEHQGIINELTGTIWRWTERVIGEWYEQKAGKSFVPVRLRLAAGSVTGGEILGVVDTAAMSILASNSGVPSGLLTSPALSKTMSAFAHEAGFAETAVNPKSDAKNVRAKPRPAPKPAAAPPVASDPAAKAPAEASPRSPQALHHLPHEEPEIK